MNAPRLALVLVLLLGAACRTPVTYEDGWMDDPDVLDPSLVDPRYRVSTRPGLTEADRGRPVVIAVHGFTASTYEWEELWRYAEAESPVLVSLVLLGGHGRSVDDFKASTWRDWGRPILEEYRALVAQGYTNIAIAGSSTGGPLIVEQLADGAYDDHPPTAFFFVDAIIVPGAKSLTLAPLLAPLVGNVQVEDATEEERRHWYQNRPGAALKQLDALTERARAHLADGIALPPGSAAYVFQSAGDEVAAPVSALLIYRGLRTATGGRVSVRMVPSSFHVFTRLQGRDPAKVSDADRARQRDAFAAVVAAVR